MADATLVINVEPAGQLGPFGADEISFLLQPHSGAPARPLGKGASGGELSRVMLAIEVVLAAVDPVPTFVFDEVDAGVGGRAAVEIGRRLAMSGGEHVQFSVEEDDESSVWPQKKYCEQKDFFHSVLQ